MKIEQMKMYTEYFEFKTLHRKICLHHVPPPPASTHTHRDIHKGILNSMPFPQLFSTNYLFTFEYIISFAHCTFFFHQNNFFPFTIM